MANSFSNDAYSSTKTLSYIVIGCFSILIICFALYFVVGIAETVTDFPQVPTDDGGGLSLGILIIGLIGLIEVMARLLTIILFLVWLYKAYKNLSALESRNLEYSPGWAVGWWFVPFVNLVKPYQIVKELWRESDSDFDANTFLSNQITTPSIIGWWWGLFIAGNIIGRIIDKSAEVDSPYFSVFLLVGSLLHGFSAYFIIEIVRRITKQQELRFQKLSSLNKFGEPPSPPKFE